MRSVTMATARGQVSMWTGPSRGGPLVFAIRGALAAQDQLCELVELLPEADVAVVDLPSAGDLSIVAFASLFREVLAPVRRPITLVGASVGGLVAMALSDLGEVIALDPPLSPPRLWPLHEIIGRKTRAGELTEASQAWWREILSCGAGAPNLDYRPLFEGVSRPVIVLAAGIPLDPPRPLPRIPGLLTGEDLEFLRRHPKVDLRICPDAGHDILGCDPAAVVRAIREKVRATAG